MILRQVTIILLLALVGLFLVSARVVKETNLDELTSENQVEDTFDENDEEEEEIHDEDEDDEEIDEINEESQEDEEEDEEEENDWIELEDSLEEEEVDALKLRPVSFSNDNSRDLTELSEEEIYNGLPAGLGAFPYVVYIQINKRFFCTGILYSRNTVITAAHCLIPQFYQRARIAPRTIIVRAGSVNRIRGGQTSVVTKYKIHPNFNPKTFTNDVALLTLKTPIKLAKKLYTAIAMFSRKVTMKKNMYWLAGYGLTTANDTQQGYPVSLQYGLLKLQPVQVCNKAFTVTKRKVSNGEFCAGGSGKGYGVSGCRGDSGGPLVTAKSEKALLQGKAQVVGMLTYGINCGLPNIFDSLTNHKTVWNFIRQNA